MVPPCPIVGHMQSATPSIEVDLTGTPMYPESQQLKLVKGTR